ncbi:Glycyl-tRNA synthetase [uncultured virus]|nr:Glycyl-tRNA synthetase [uncultured virus]
MEELVSLCKRKGFVFPSSEIYGGNAGFFDYGPLGVEMKRNIIDNWWKTMISNQDNMVGLDSSIITNPNVWVASGHVKQFNDPLIEDVSDGCRYRADHLYVLTFDLNDTVIATHCITDKDTIPTLRKRYDKRSKQSINWTLEECSKLSDDELSKLPSPISGKIGTLKKLQNFNLMLTTNVGSMENKSYLRPETAQGIFCNFKSVLNSSRMSIPFGIGQVGKAFRNEICPRNFLFRGREFEQMEIEYFIDDVADWKSEQEAWIQRYWDWLLSIGVKRDLLSKEVHAKEDLAHYALGCTDIIFKYPFGESELMGVAARGNYDLTQHTEHSKTKLEYYDVISKRTYVPQVIEPSIGVDRLILALLVSAYDVDVIDGEKRNVLRFHKKIAPVKIGIFPLLSNKEPLKEKAKQITTELRRKFAVQYDESGAIGRRYRRMDEIGTPYCITVDFQSLTDNTVTVRERDSTKQERVSISDLESYFDTQFA